jgi:hypothetical protein
LKKPRRTPSSLARDEDRLAIRQLARDVVAGARSSSSRPATCHERLKTV